MTLARLFPALRDIRQAVARQRSFAGRFFDDLAAGSTDPAGGITRDTYGPGENFGHAVMAAAARGCGFDVTVDAAANTYARWPAGRDDRTVVMGSHLDSVQRGGNFDGAAGPLAGLVAMRALRDMGARPRVTLCAMGIRAEESVWFQTSYIGSRAALATLPLDTYDTARRIDTGRTLAEHMAECGCDLGALRKGERALDPASVDAYVEVHIEQAPSLDEDGISVAVCTAVPGNFRFPQARIEGVHGHVGTPRRFRTDAAMAGARLAMEVDRLWRAEEAKGHSMAVTFGRFHTDPDMHGLTTVAGLFHFSVDVRAHDPTVLSAVEAEFHRIVAAVEAEHHVRIHLGERKSAPVGLADPGIRAGLHRAARDMGVQAVDLGSPASHDAAAFAAAGVAMAMLLVRNANGSHNPEEAMEMDDFLEACTVLTAWLYETYCL